MSKIFAPFGLSDELYEKNCENAFSALSYLKNIGLNGFEYDLSEGIHISSDGCKTLKDTALENGISLSFYLGGLYSISAADKKIRENGIKYLADCIKAAKSAGAKRVVIPLESCALIGRKTVFERTVYAFKRALFTAEADELILCPELMGKIHDFGTFDEILSVCKTDERFVPALNLANLFAREQGKAMSREYIKKLFSDTEKKLGKERADKLHIYIARAYFTNQGLKKYADFSDDEAPKFDITPIMNELKQKNPFIVCRSPYKNLTDTIYIKERILNS